MKTLSNKKRVALIIPVAMLALFLGVLISANLGYTELPLSRIIKTLFGFGSPQDNFVIWDIRIPRTVVALFTGVCLALSGAVMQGVTRNPMATPSLIGVSSGASFGILIVVFLFDKGLPMLMPRSIAAVLGGIVVFFIVYSFSTRYALSPTKLILNGIAINSCIGAITHILTLQLSENAFLMLTFSQAGNLTYATWDIIMTGILVAVPCIIVILYKVHTLNILNLGDEMAVGLGIDLRQERKNLLLITIILASIAVYVAGTIGFVGLIAPHMARRIVGANFKYFLPVSMALGALLVVVGDIIARLLVNQSNAELVVPIGLIISVIGAPYLLYLLYVQDR